MRNFPVHRRSTKIRYSIFSKCLPSDPTPARVRSADRTHPNERWQRVNPRSRHPSRSDVSPCIFSTSHRPRQRSSPSSSSAVKQQASPNHVFGSNGRLQMAISNGLGSSTFDLLRSSYSNQISIGCISPIRRHLTMASNMPGSISESIFIPWQPTRQPTANQRQLESQLITAPSSHDAPANGHPHPKKSSSLPHPAAVIQMGPMARQLPSPPHHQQDMIFTNDPNGIDPSLDQRIRGSDQFFLKLHRAVHFAETSSTIYRPFNPRHGISGNENLKPTSIEFRWEAEENGSVRSCKRASPSSVVGRWSKASSSPDSDAHQQITLHNSH
ncbi:hypothetical protein ACLOJK_029236, partial [Asimina triloba]